MGMNSEKPSFTADQLISSSNAAKNFGELRKRAKKLPLFITDNGEVDTVVMGYQYFEQMYARLKELEEKEEAHLLQERIDRLDQNPSAAIPWKKVRRSPQEQGEEHES